MTYARWPQPARNLAEAVDAAVSAVARQNRPGLDEAVAALARLDREQAADLLGTMARDLLEGLHPDGLDAEDAGLVLQRCTAAATPWYGPVDTDALLEALTGALGTAPPEVPRPPEDVVRAGLLLLADLLGVSRRRLPAVLDAAITELHRAQTVEFP